MAPLVLLQSSDWHVGSSLAGRGLALTEELRARRREEVDAAPERLAAVAGAVRPDAVLLPGDLWDAENVPPGLFRRLVEALASLAPVPVFVAPGNHDYAGSGGFYDETFLGALGLPAWPANVSVFRTAAWESRPVPGREDATVTGRAFLSPLLESGRPLEAPPPRPGVPFPLLMLHGSLESYRGPDAPTGPKRTAPFSAEELEAAGFAWAALGHHHAFEVVARADGRAAAAYSGSPTGRGLDETGPRVFLKVTLDPETPPRLETIPADARQVLDVELEAAGRDAEGLREAALARLLDAGATTADFVRLTVRGRPAAGTRASAALADLRGLVAHIVVRDRTATEPEGRSDRSTAEGRFLLDLEARIASAPDARSRRVAELARSVGREALAGRLPTPPPPEDV